MRLASALAASLLLLCVTGCVATRLSVFREDFNGVPGRTFVVVHGEDSSNSGGVLPGSVEWLFQQMALLRVMQSHLMLNSVMPPQPNAMTSATGSIEDTLRHVRCQRMRQAMIEEDQGVWRSTFGGDSDVSATRPALAADEDADDNSDDPHCFDVRGERVACNSDDAVMQDNWLDIVRPVETADVPSLAALTSRRGPSTSDAATSTGSWRGSSSEVAGAPSGPDSSDASTARVSSGGGVYRQLRPANGFDAAADAQAVEDDDEDDEDDEDTDMVDSAAGPRWRGYRSGGHRGVEAGVVHGSMSSSGSSSSSDGNLPLDQEPVARGMWDGQPDARMVYRERPDHPPAGGLLLATGGVLCAALVTFGALALLVLAVVRRRCSPFGDVDGVLVAPLLVKAGGVAAGQPVQVCGIKVAAAEAQRDAVEGIDTSAALLKGEGLARSH